MLDVNFLVKNREDAKREMSKRFSLDKFNIFLKLYDSLKKTGKITPRRLETISRKVTLKKLEKNLKKSDSLYKLIDVYLRLPNICDPRVPKGKDKLGDIVISENSKPPVKLPRNPKSYEVLGNILGIFNKSASKKVTAGGFPFLFGQGAQLDRALKNFMLDTHIKNGYQEIMAPTLVNERSMFTTGAFPFFAKKSYQIKGTGLYLNPTIEVQETNLFRNTHFSNSQLPIRLVGYSRSFRIENQAMTTYTTLHEFGKVEIFVATKKETWESEFKRALLSVEEVLNGLKLPYRKVLLCTGSMGQGYHMTFDFYVFLPSSKEWLEVASCASNSDFSSRRMNATYINSKGQRDFIHTLHITSLAIPRLLCSVLENYQTVNNKIIVPEVLRPYLKLNTIKETVYFNEN